MSNKVTPSENLKEIKSKTNSNSSDSNIDSAFNINIKKTVKNLSIEILTIMLGTFIMAFGFEIFLTPHNIVPGGFMGVAKIIYDLLSQTGFTAISISVWYIILNIFLYLYAVKILGWKFAVRAGAGIASYSLFVELIERSGLITTLTNHFEAEVATSFILYAIYGGLLMGIGIGFVFRGNGSTGGSDVVAVVVNKFFPTITTGQIMITVDGIVVILSAIVYQSLVLPLYALITIFITGKVSDMFVDGIRSLRAYYIVTDKKEELSQEIFAKLNRGVTNLKCEGMFTRNDKDMLLIIVRRSQVIKLKKIVKRVDPNSFMFSHNVKEAFGNGFVSQVQEKHSKIKGNKLAISKSTENIETENLEAKNSEINNTEINSAEVHKTQNSNAEVSSKLQNANTGSSNTKNTNAKSKTKTTSKKGNANE